ncbi:MAG: hypothetical protein JWQ09_4906, partial [Segetibacter sp.]|nr:hypothetical protein [Segetibacter sp.]
MKKLIALSAIIICLTSFSKEFKHYQEDKWISLFDGKSLDGWKVGANAET